MLVGFFAQNHELFATEARDDVGVPLLSLQDLAEPTDDHVADVVAVGVLDERIHESNHKARRVRGHGHTG